MNYVKFIYAHSAGGGGGVGGVGVTCFFGDQHVLMANGDRKRIDVVQPGEYVEGRWGNNKVNGIEKPLLEDRPMYLINGEFYNTGDHPIWTDKGWAVVDKDYYVEHDYECRCTIYGADKVWDELYRPCKPDKILQLKVGDMIAVPGGWRKVSTILKNTLFDPETQLYSLHLDNNRTMYVDGYCVSGWANHRKFDYDARIGT